MNKINFFSSVFFEQYYTTNIYTPVCELIYVIELHEITNVQRDKKKNYLVDSTVANEAFKNNSAFDSFVKTQSNCLNASLRLHVIQYSLYWMVYSY